MADNLFLQDDLSRVRGMPAPRVRGPSPLRVSRPDLNHTDEGYLGSVSMRSGLPPNLVAAMAERARLGEDDFDQESFEARANTLGQVGGNNLQSAIAEAYGEDSRDLMSRANAIADLWEGRTGERVEDNRSLTGRVGDAVADTALSFLGGAVSGTGTVLSSAADVVESPRLEGAAGEGFMGAVTNLVGAPSRGVASLIRGAGGATDALGEWISSGVSDENRQKMESIQFDGNLFEPSTWDVSGLSLEGALLLASDVFGNLAPVVASSLVNPAAPAVTGGLQSYGFGKEEQRERMEDLAETGELQENSTYYQELLAAGLSEEEALERTIEAGTTVAGMFAAPVGAFGGHLTGRIFRGAVGNAVGGGLARRLGSSAIIGGLEEGTQEALEGIATITGGNIATGLSLDPMQDTLGDFIVGALAGAPVGAIGGGRSRQEEPPPEAQLALPPPSDTPALPPPAGPAALPPPSAERQPAAAHGTIISGGPVRGGPGSNFVPYPRQTDVPRPSDPSAALRPPTTPTGPLSEAVATVSPRAPEPAASPLFPEMRPGTALTLASPEGGAVNATFLREDSGSVIVRAQGQEVAVPAVAFDAALLEVNGRPRPGAHPPGPQALEATTDAAPVAAHPPQASLEAEPGSAAGEIPSARVLREDVSVTPSGREIPVQYALVEADDLVASNLDDGRVNPAYPADLQPRDRTRPASQQQVHDIAANLDPRLLGETVSASDGAPVVSPDGVVEGGNGRVMSLRRAYAEGGASAQRYRDHLAAQGYPVDGMHNPVLVRLRDPNMERADVIASTVEMNERTTMDMSSTERAMADARSISPEAVGLYRGGDIDSASNRDFVRAFMRDAVSDSDRAGMIDADGRMSQEAARRVQAALLARAYGDANLVAALTEASDNNIKAIGGALTDVAGRWAQMRAEAEAGTIAREVDATDALMEAVHVVDQARTSGRNVAEYVKQTDMFSGDAISERGKHFLRLMFHNTEQWTRPTSRARLASALGFYVDEAMKTSAGVDLLGGSADPDAIARAARSRIDANEAQGQGGLFSRGPAVESVPEDGGQRVRSELEASVSDERAASQPAGREPADPDRAAVDLLTREGFHPGEGQSSTSYFTEWLRSGGDTDRQWAIRPSGATRYRVTVSSRNPGVGSIPSRTLGPFESLTDAADAAIRDRLERSGQGVPATESAAAVATAEPVSRPLDEEDQRIARAAEERQAEIDSIPVDLRPIWDEAQGVPGTIRGVNDSSGARSTFARGVLDVLTDKPARTAAGPVRQSIYDKGRKWAEGRVGAQEGGAEPEGGTPQHTPPTAEEVDAAAAVTDPAPTPAQAEAENYKTGKIDWNGLTLSIENAKDSIRRKVGKNGVEWQVTMPAHYGRILRTEGADGDHVDFYMGPNPESDLVVIVDQVDVDTGRFDEHKVMLGMESPAEARDIYERGFSDGRGAERLGAFTEMTVSQFKEWLEAGSQNGPVGVIADADATAPQAAPRAESTTDEGADAEPTSSDIEDFGEVLEGARKHIWAEYADRMKGAQDLDPESVPLSKSWPAPDYVKMVAGGVDPWRVSAIRVLRESIPTKPSKGWKLKGWSETMVTLRTLAGGVLNSSLTQEGFDGLLARSKLGRNLRSTIRLYEEFGHEKSLKGVSLEFASFTRFDAGVATKVERWEVRSKAKATAFSNWPKVHAFGNTEREAIEAFRRVYSTLGETQRKDARTPKFVGYSHDGGKYYTVGVKSGRRYVELRRVDSVEEARRVISEEKDALTQELERLKAIPDVRRKSNEPRVGIDHRNGGNVTPEQFSEAFGFRGVQFGNWVEGSRRQTDLNESFDALMDLAGILGVPPRALSLNGTLGLAFGARGRGGKDAGAAHFEPDTVVINLTKKEGAGSLAHEWFHAIDNYFARSIKSRTGVKGAPLYLSENSTPGSHVEGLRPEVVDAFLALKSTIAQSGLLKRSEAMDAFRSGPYWSSGREMAARSFESYVVAKLHDQGVTNDYLANIVSDNLWASLYEGTPDADRYPYPTSAEMDSFRSAYDGLFEAIEIRESDSGIEMYRRVTGEGSAEPVNAERLQSVSRTVRDILSAHGIDGRVTARAVGRLMSSAGTPVLGLYRPGQISVNAAAADPAHVTRHEIIHALRSMGLFTDAEWAGLVRAARANEAVRKRIEAAYPDVSEGIRDEEMVAEYYADWAAGEEVKVRPAIVMVFDRIREVFRAMASALRSDGQVEAAEIMRRIARGEIGRRGVLSRTGTDAPGRAAMINTDTKAFKDWFGDSKVVDDSGKPLVVYHGTTADVASFDPERRGSATGSEDSKRGFFFASNPDVAATYAAGVNPYRETSIGRFLDRITSGGYGRTNEALLRALRLPSAISPDGPIMPVYLSVKNPYVHDFAGEEYSDEGFSSAITAAVEGGHDGAILKNTYDEGFIDTEGDGRTDVIVAFSPTQIKSVYNEGTFDPDDPRIMHQRDMSSDGSSSTIEREMRMFAADPGSNPADAARKEKAFISRLLDLASSKMTDYMGPGGRVNVLSLVPGRPLFTEMGKEMPSTLQYQRLKERMDTDRETLLQDAGEFTNNWRRLLSQDSKANRAMMDLMHEATLAEVDPSTEFKPVAHENDAEAARNSSSRISGPAQERIDRDIVRRREYARLKAVFDGLPKEYRKLFQDVRDRYSQQADEIEKAVIDNVRKAMKVAEDRAQRSFDEEMRRIRDEGLAGDERAVAEADARKKLDQAKAGHARSRAGRINSLRVMFESNRVEGPYFPLLRFGNYYVTARNADGAVVSFSKFEAERGQKVAAAALKRDGWAVEVGTMDTDGALRRQVDPRFVADVETLLADTGVPEGVMDDIWQSYLATMPDLSLRKSRIHRKGTPGFSGDAFRAFAKQMFHGGHQLARLRHALDMQNALEAAEQEVQKARDPNRAMAVLSEMKRRHEFTMNPKGSSLAQAVTSLSFAWFLGMTPAAAAVNLTQTTVVGVPVLAAGFSKKRGGTIGRAAREIGKASRDFAKGRGVTDRSSGLTSDERAAMKAAYDRGIVDKTQSHDLAGITEQGVDPTGSVLRGILGEEGTHKWVGARMKAMEAIAFLFHHAERFNREVTFLAAYRMSKRAGLDHEAAIDKAGDLTWKAHFDYSSSARPRIIQNDVGKVLMVFRNFQINMLWRLFRDSHQALKGADAETRREARMQLIGITSMMMLHAGITGTWGYALLVTVLSMLPGAGSDDDIEDEIKAALVNTFGAQIAGVMLKGVPGHVTGMDVSQRIGLPELWFRQDDRDLEGRDAYYMRLSEIAGAPLGIVENTFRGTHMVSEGNTWRGVETMMPKFLKDIMKSARYLNEGVTTMRGDHLTDASWVDAAKQVFGFVPAAISEQYERNNRQRNAQRRIEDRRRRLMGDAAREIMGGRVMSERTRREIQEFNREIPEWSITRASLRQSIRSRNRFTQQTVDGLRLNPRLDRRIRGAAPPAIYAQ